MPHVCRRGLHGFSFSFGLALSPGAPGRLLAFCLLVLSVVAGAQSAAKSIAITIDDVPILATTSISFEEIQSVNARLLKALKEHDVKAVAFVNEDRVLRPGRIDAGAKLLEQWLDAGMEIGNHNYGHLGLWKSSLAEVQDAVIKGEVLSRLLTSQRGAPLRYYRHPFTQTGKDEAEKAAFEAFLAARGYTIAPFTIEHDDYVYSCVYEKLTSTQQDERRQLVEEYGQQLKQAVDAYEKMSEQLFGRQIPQILLIHATRLNADALDSMLRTLKALGYRFITLDEALRDEAYRSEAKASQQHGPSWLSRWARAKGKRLTIYGHADPAGLTAKLAATLCP